MSLVGYLDVLRMDVQLHLTPTLPAKPMRRSMQVSLFQYELSGLIPSSIIGKWLHLKKKSEPQQYLQITWTNSKQDSVKGPRSEKTCEFSL